MTDVQGLRTEVIFYLKRFKQKADPYGHLSPNSSLHFFEHIDNVNGASRQMGGGMAAWMAGHPQTPGPFWSAEIPVMNLSVTAFPLPC